MSEALRQALTAALDELGVPLSGDLFLRSVGGGCINQTYRIDSGEHAYFVKLNDPDAYDMFAVEAEGLTEIRASNSVRVPEVIGHGIHAGRACLILEYIDLRPLGAASAGRFGEQLAQMHRSRAKDYGWTRDNTIGSTPQDNARQNDWIKFWSENRIGFQLDLAARNGYGGSLQRQGERLLAAMPGLLAGHQPEPSLLHGDLWGGNCAADSEGNPVIFDPACYHGDRECDLAMTELFGSLPSDFYRAYQSAWPIDSGYTIRRDLYNLYHILNHLNLFGGHYLGQAESVIRRLLAA
ncbi:MAG: phosphotransferase [Gammaproteobacteria bacterium]|nr:phosphotransferase [Gammaproteobacteria bacterium]